MIFTVVGTLTHEYGHILVAKAYGFETQLHYDIATYYPKGYKEDPDYLALDSLLKRYKNVPYDYFPESVKDEHQKLSDVLQERYWNDNQNHLLYITLGGPAQTMIVGSLAFLLLLKRRKLRISQSLKLFDWLTVFLSLFWLRQVFNLIMSIIGELIVPDGNWFVGDEQIISEELGLWDGTVPIILGAIGSIICFYTVFKVIPKPYRLNFIISGLIGGILGLWLWMGVIGPLVLR